MTFSTVTPIPPMPCHPEPSKPPLVRLEISSNPKTPSVKAQNHPNPGECVTPLMQPTMLP